MARNYYSEINLHIVWHTKGSLPLLTPEVEPFVHRYLRGKVINTPGVFIHEVGGIETHVHLAVTIAPTILISDLIGKLKGASSHETNQQLGHARKLLEWQAGYGVVSFGTANLQWVVHYIRNQRAHHSRGTIEDRLERITHDDDKAEAEPREGPQTGLVVGYPRITRRKRRADYRFAGSLVNEAKDHRMPHSPLRACSHPGT